MADIFDVDPIKKFMCLLVGPNGSGKSILIGSWKEAGPVYTFDFDGRMASVANYYKSKGQLKRGELEFDTYGPGNLYEAYDKLQTWVENGRCPYSAIAIDSFTAVTVSAVTFSLRRRQGKGGNNLPKNSKGDMIIPDWDEWNGEATYVTMLLDLCKQLASWGTAVFWTAHPVQRMKIEAQGSTVQRVSYQTKYAAFGTKSDSLIPIYFNEIYALYPEYDVMQPDNIQRICQTQPIGDIAAKTALNIPSKINWTNHPSFYRLFKGLVEKGNDYALVNESNAGVNEVKEEEKKETFKL